MQCDGQNKETTLRLTSAICLTLGLHIVVAVTLYAQKPVILKPDLNPISVKLIVRQTPAVSLALDDLPIDQFSTPQPQTTPVTPSPEPTSKPSPSTEPVLSEPTSPLETALDPRLETPPVTAPLTIAPPQGRSDIGVPPTADTNGAALIPDRWQLPPDAKVFLDNVRSDRDDPARSFDCLKGFNVDCADIRKSLFANEQLSETDLIWMPTFAHSGLSDSSLYGLSEVEIRERLGIPTAGQNGFVIIPGLLGLDGPIWDSLHGVNSHCSYAWVIGEDGRRQVQKSCPELKGGTSSIPLYRTGNEFQRRTANSVAPE